MIGKGIPFNKPYMTGRELAYIAEAHANGHLSGDGPFTKRCHAWLERTTGTRRALLTHSCTGALEMAALLMDLAPGDEVIMPSFTFVSTANAVVLRGAVPVFVDIRADTLNIDENLIEVGDHIAHARDLRCALCGRGLRDGCDPCDRAAPRLAWSVEDAAQGILSTYKGRPLGSIGELGALSFHETKNIISGEGGALLVNDPNFVERAEIIREKGTNRSQFFRGQVDKYTWVDIGSSYLPSEILAAFLAAQIEDVGASRERRLAVWTRYHDAFAALEARGLLRRPIVPAHCTHNAHMYYVLLRRSGNAHALHRGDESQAISIRCSTMFHCTARPQVRTMAARREILPITDRPASASCGCRCGCRIWTSSALSTPWRRSSDERR